MTLANGARQQPTQPIGQDIVHVPLDVDVTDAARTDMCVLLTGSPQRARELAYRIHSESGWRYGPFMVVDCSWPEAMLDTLLFGTLTSVEDTDCPGGPRIRLEQAGTVFLKEVSHLSPAMQARLAEQLAWLRARRRPGRRRRRLIASTSTPLLARALEGRFNEQLYYRLNMIHMCL